MDEGQLQSIRRFNRLVTRRVGALEVDYLRRGRPLAEARLIFEIGADGADVRTLRSRLELDSGLSQSPAAILAKAGADRSREGKRRRSPASREFDAQRVAERAAYDRLSDNLAASMLTPLDASAAEPFARGDGRGRALIRAASVKIAAEAPDERRRAPVPRRVFPRA